MVGKTKIFLDSGNPEETKNALKMIDLDGQTTNPSLFASNPGVVEKKSQGEKFSSEQLLSAYKDVVQEVSELIPSGSVSIEVYADASTTSEDMLTQAREFNTWIPNAHIKFPTNEAGLAAAEQAVAEGMRVNMTLVFSQAQAAAVHAATRGASKSDVFVSPFIGRLDDIDLDGMDLITNIQTMYKLADSHVSLLVASVRDLEHFLYSLYADVDIITSPLKVLQMWADAGKPVPGIDIPVAEFIDENSYLNRSADQDIFYQELDLEQEWRSFPIAHELTEKGIAKFSSDWNALIS